MSLLQQAIQLLSESPGNVIYHLATLFALQAVFAISFSQWQRDRSDGLAARMAWAAGAVFLTRVGLLLTGIALQADPLTAVTILAPLEQAVHTVTAVLIAWAIVPHSTRYLRLGRALLILALAIIGVMALSFTQAWQSQAAVGEAYNGSQQATVWGIFQLGALGLGLVFILGRSRFRFSLPAIIIGLLLLAHLAHFWNYPEIIATNTNIAYWVRLGHLAVFPLWAAFAYRRSFGSVLLAQQMRQPAAEQIVRSLNLAAGVIRSVEPKTAVFPAIEMAAKMTNATFVGLALRSSEEDRQLYLTSNQPQAAQDKPRSWYLNLVDWPAFRQALEQNAPVMLLPEGMGARQLHDWYLEMGMSSLGALFIQPLLIHREAIGLLLLAGPREREAWGEADRLLVGSLAVYLAQAIDNGRYLERIAQQAATAAAGPLEPDTAVTGRIVALEEERDQLQADLETTAGRLHQAEARTVAANRQARDLAATLDEMERVSRDEQIDLLEAEIEALRESLIEAEEAMALAAAGESELSTEWVMHTITRYSGQLEEAQARIQALEEELGRRGQGPVNDVVASLVQELRTPMTSIAGFTELLLAERIGILGVKQRDFVQRVQANAARMGTLLEQIVQLTAGVEAPASRPDDALVNVEKVVESAVSAVITHLREKNLRLEINIPANLPLLPVDQSALRQIMTSLLGNACQSSPNDSRIAVTVRADNMASAARAGDNGQNESFQFMHLAVTDSGGGISVQDRGRVFDPQHNADSPLIAGLGDTGAALSVARALAEVNGGRIWVDSALGVGSTFSALFPVTPTDGLTNGETAVPGPVAGGNS